MKTVVTCPRCSTKQEEEVPENLSLVGYNCAGCGSEVYSEKNFCIFCDYGERPCPALHFKFNRSFVELAEEVNGSADRERTMRKKNG